MIIRDLTYKQFDALKLYKQGSESTLYIDPKNSELLLKIYPQALANKKASRDSLFAASEIRPQIQHTSLPLGEVNVEGRFRGSVLEFHRHHYPTSKFRSLPVSTQIKVLRNLIRKIKELSDNNIYHLDLANINYQYFRDGFSSLLITKTGDAEIVSLDGNSVIYSPYSVPEQEIFMRTQTNKVVYELLRQSIESNDRQSFWKKPKDIAAKKAIISSLHDKALYYDELNDVVGSVLTKK